MKHVPTDSPQEPLPGKAVKIGGCDDGLILEFETEADAIAMMPEGLSVFERRGHQVIMKAKRAAAKRPLHAPNP